MIVGYGRIDVVVELRELVHVIPDAFVGGVENMRSVLVNVDAIDLARVHVAGDMVALVDDEAALARLFRLMREHGAREAGRRRSDNHIEP